MIPCIHTDVYCMNSQYIALPKEKRRNINGELITLQTFALEHLSFYSHLRNLFVIFYFPTTTQETKTHFLVLVKVGGGTTIG